MGYTKITEKDVVEVIMKTAHDWQGCGIISPSNIAHLLNTSRYQVNKYIRGLKNKGLIEYKSISIGDDEELFPPYNGYKLSEQGEKEYSEELKKLREEELKIIEKCFGFENMF